ncbi:ATP-grasp domain-containing protein [Labilithrix luteola]|nr:ATP-grasp domain-containing protein [Labilithrix luteola]
MRQRLLLIPEKADVERDAVATAWKGAGGSVMRIGRFWDPPDVDRSRVHVYGNDTFCLVLAEKLSLQLVSPSDHILASIPKEFARREIRILPLADLKADAFPVFVKSVIPKQFKSAVYDSEASLTAETQGLAASEEVLVSSVVTFVAEARAFVLDGSVRACAIYEGEASAADAARFAERIVSTMGAPTFPRTCVVDVGLMEDGQWALVECNAPWGAGLNGCDPAPVLACIAAASEPK